MVRPMRRKKQILPENETVNILQSNTSGVLALEDDGGYPYAVPLSYVYHDGKIYFHCALSGHKTDLIEKSNKASFCIIDQDEVVPEKYTTLFKSAIAFGTVTIVTDAAKKQIALEQLLTRYSPGFEEKGVKEIERFWNQVCVLEFDIDYVTGKQAIELVKSPDAE